MKLVNPVQAVRWLLVIGFVSVLSSSSRSDAFAQSTSADADPKPRIDTGLAFTMRAASDKRVTLPRITHFPDGEVMNRVNSDLDTEAAKLQEKAKRCDKAGEDKSDWEETARVDLLTPEVLSIDLVISYYCGGPHPDEEYLPLTYNLKTGRRFDFEKDAAQLFVGDFLPTDRLLDLYRRNYGKPEGGCNLSDIRSDTISQLNLHFSADGLVINPDLPHVMAACGPEIVIPYRQVKPLIKPDNPFASLFASALSQRSLF